MRNEKKKEKIYENFENNKMNQNKI